MKKYKILALVSVFLMLVQSIPAQDVVFKAQTRLVVVNVSVKDKAGKPVLDLKKEDFDILEDGKKQTISQFEFEKLANDLLPAAEPEAPKQLEQRVAPKPAAPPPTPAAAPPPVNVADAKPARKDRRLVAMFFDMTTMPQLDQLRAQENAIKFINTQMTSSDLVEILTYGNKLNVIEDFTDDRERLLEDLKKMVIGEGTGLAGAAATAGCENDDSGTFTQDDTEFNIFNTDRQLAALEDAVKKLAAFPEKKALVYFSSGISKNGIDNQSQLKNTINSAVRANVAIYSVDARGLQASAPSGDASTASSRGTGNISGSNQQSRRNSFNDSQETLTTLSADTGGKALLDDNDLSMGFKEAQQDLGSYYILAYYSTNSAEDGKYRHLQVKLTNTQLLAQGIKATDYKEGYYANKVFQKFTAADKEQQLQEALTLGDPVTDLPLVLETDYFRVANNRYFVPISVKIPGSEIALAKKNGAEVTDFDFVGQILDAKGKVPVGLPNWASLGLKEGISIKLKDTDAAQLEKRNVQYDAGLTLPPGKYIIRFLARENQTGKMGMFEKPFTIPDLSLEKALKLSSVIWSSQKEAVAAAVGSVNNSKNILANDPLIENGQKIVPSITDVFRKDQTLYVYFEVYDATVDPTSKAPSVAAEIDLYRGVRKVYTSPPSRVTKLTTARPGVTAFSFTIPLTSLAAGRYTAQVSVIDENGRKFAFPRGQIAILPDASAQTAAVQ
jgi:VWFA-related protein